MPEINQTKQRGLSITDAGTLSPEDFTTNLAHCRDSWGRYLGLDPDTSLYTIAQHLASKIVQAINDGEKNGSDLRTLKKAVRNASKVGSFSLLGSLSLNGVTPEFFHHSKDDPSYWRQRLVGEMRLVLSGLTDRRSIQRALRSLVDTDVLNPYITGPDGYRRVAEIFCQGSMLKAFMLMSAVCKAEALDFKKLEWGAQFAGTTKQFAALRAEVK
jgi:hypothetical protein